MEIRAKYYMIISIDGENTFDKVQHTFVIKVPKKLATDGTCLNMK
jgi:hypothetical protein